MTLWEVLESKGTHQQSANVEELTKYAGDLLDLVRDTFPTYTLHNRVHAKNVISLMENLLGDKVHDLSALEAAMLILAAYFHDAGMAFTDDERNEIQHTEQFAAYLRDNPAEYLRYKENDEVPDRLLIEGFCRWTHADRVKVILARVPEDRLRWGNVPIGHHLGELCRSHNFHASGLKDEIFDRNFIDQCDLRLCAILLRLADILDFDNTRSPDAVYRHMGIQHANTERLQNSDVEWRKHLKSDGFVFPEARSPDYTLGFIAAPDHPVVQHDILEFLVVIESELAACKQLMAYCSDRWRNLDLPGTISRSGIISDGFTYGDFRFKLDKEAVLELFMGENLYSSTDVFLRELLQNSIDAVRARCRLEGINPELSGYGVRITEWQDGEGYQWIRIDDDGCGMDLDIIDKFLLRVGASYYSTPTFKAELLRAEHRDQPPMVPIGKFGVGLLSAFLVSSRIELTTRRIGRHGLPAEPVRLSFPHKTDFLVVQTESRQSIADEMPNSFNRSESGYRRADKPGTSIALKIDPAKVSEKLDLKRLCNRYLLNSLVPVRLDGVPVGVREADDQNESIDIRLDWSAETSALHPDVSKALAGVTLHLQKLDISASRARKEIDGRGYAVMIDASELRTVLSTTDLLNLPGLEGLSEDDIRSRNGDDSDLRDGPNIELSFMGKDMAFIKLSFYSASAYNTIERIAPYATDVHTRFASIGETNVENGFEFSASVKLSKLGMDLPDGYLDEDEDDDDFDEQVHPDFIFDDPMYWDDDWYDLDRPSISSWSHNGIRLPFDFLKSNEEWMQFTTKDRNNYVRGNILASFWLTDALRPDLNVARDHVRSAPYALVSGLQLTMRRALIGAGRSSAADNLLTNTSVFNNLNRMSGEVTLAEVLADPLTTAEDGWKSESLFLVDGHTSRLSVFELARNVTNTRQVVTVLPTGHFADVLSLALLQLNFKITSLGFGRYEVKDVISEVQFDNRLLPYPPGSFVYYESASVLRRSHKRGYYEAWDVANLSHPFVDWYISVSPLLRVMGVAADRKISEFLVGHRPRLRKDFSKLRDAVKNANRILGTAGPSYAGGLDKGMLKAIK